MSHAHLQRTNILFPKDYMHIWKVALRSKLQMLGTEEPAIYQ